MIICAGREETFPFAEPMGVGLIESSINLTRRCLFDKPDFILFIGTAGSYGKFNIFDIVESKRASNLELSFLSQDSYTPLDNVLESENKMVRNDTIVKTCEKYNNYGIGIENMEYFSILSVAKEFEIPVAGIFIVTNFTNENAHKDFIKNHKEAMSRLTQYLIDKKIIR
jgi:nucleoside phosphorylase